MTRVHKSNMEQKYFLACRVICTYFRVLMPVHNDHVQTHPIKNMLVPPAMTKWQLIRSTTQGPTMPMMQCRSVQSFLNCITWDTDLWQEQRGEILDAAHEPRLCWARQQSCHSPAGMQQPPSAQPRQHGQWVLARAPPMLCQQSPAANTVLMTNGDFSRKCQN